jgi:hypothetical protein
MPRPPLRNPVASLGLLHAMRAVLLIGLYLAAGLAFAIAVDADPENFTVVFFVTLAAALIVGWGTGDAGWRGLWLWLLLPWVIVALGLPFGGASQTFNDGNDIYDVSVLAVFAAIPAMIAMPLAAGARALYERRHRPLPGHSAA